MRLIAGRQTAAIGERPDDYGGPAVALPAFVDGSDLIAGVQFAEVAVDERLGRVTVERIVAVQDCGRCLIHCLRRVSFRVDHQCA